MTRGQALMQRAEAAQADALSRLAADLGLPEDSDALAGLSRAWFSGFAFAAGEWVAWMRDEKGARKAAGPEPDSPTG